MLLNVKAIKNLEKKIKNHTKIVTVLYIFVAIAIITSTNKVIADNSSSRKSIWDFALPDMVLNNVDINAISLQDAWKKISDNFLLRSVLVVSDNSLKDIPFTFKTGHCSGAELLDALSESYRDFMWTQDSNTGIIWFHPKNLELVEILPYKMRIEREQLGVPMQDGILEAIEDIPNGIRVKRWGTGFSNTFNYPVDLHAGEYCIRDLLNVCCAANPNKTFYIQLYKNREPKFTVISAVNLLSDELKDPTTGALLFWTLEIGTLTEQVPTSDQIAAALADTDPKIRWAARKYTEIMVSHFPFETLMNKPQSQEKTLWICLGATNIFVRSEKVTYTDGIKRLQAVSKEFLEKGDPNLAVLIALKLAELTNDTNALEIVSKRNFNKGELNQIKSEINFSARISSEVRNALRTTGTNWLSVSDISFKDIEKITSKASFIKSN